MRIRRLLVLACVVALVSACGDDDAADLTTDESGSADDGAGGATITLAPAGSPSTDDLARTVDVIEQRLAALEIDGASVDASSGDVVVELPGGDEDVESIADLVSDTAELTFRPVLQVVPADVVPDCDGGGAEGVPAELFPQFDGGGDEPTLCYSLGDAALTGTAVEGAEASSDGVQGGTVALTIVAGPDGIDAFNDVAAGCFNRSDSCPSQQLAIVLDDVVVSAPSINEPAFERDAITISGNFSEAQATNLAAALRSGALPVALEVVDIEPAG